LDAKKPLDLHQAASFRDTYPSRVDARLLFSPAHPEFVGGEFYCHFYHACQLAATFASSSDALIRVTALDTEAGEAPVAIAASAGRTLSQSTMRAASCAGPDGLRVSFTREAN